MAEVRGSPLPAAQLPLRGGRLCVDFVNTVSGDRAGLPFEKLHAYGDLLDWAVHAEAVDRDTAARLRERAAGEPEAAEAVFARAIALRERLHRVLFALAGGAEPPADEVQRLSAAIGEALATQELVAGPDGFRWSWPDTDDLERPLWPVARSAGDLLTAPDDLRRLRVCDGHECGWLFVDESRNRRRRWCDMADCGNRAKARRHYQRTRAAASD